MIKISKGWLVFAAVMILWTMAIAVVPLYTLTTECFVRIGVRDAGMSAVGALMALLPALVHVVISSHVNCPENSDGEAVAFSVAVPVIIPAALATIVSIVSQPAVCAASAWMAGVLVAMIALPVSLALAGVVGEK